MAMLKKNQVAALATEMNKVMRLEPEIDITIKLEDLEKGVRDNANLMEVGDTYSKAAVATMKLLGLDTALKMEFEEAGIENMVIKAITPLEPGEEPEPAATEPPATEAAAGKDKPATAKKPKNRPSMGELKLLVAGLVTEGKYTRAEIIEKVKSEFPDRSDATISTVLSDGKNPKYCAFEFCIVQDATTKVLSFGDVRAIKKETGSAAK